MNNTTSLVCPTCRGELEQRRRGDWPKVELVYACLGSCGIEWSAFDLNLMQQKDKQPRTLPTTRRTRR